MNCRHLNVSCSSIHQHVHPVIHPHGEGPAVHKGQPARTRFGIKHFVGFLCGEDGCIIGFLHFAFRIRANPDWHCISGMRKQSAGWPDPHIKVKNKLPLLIVKYIGKYCLFMIICLLTLSLPKSLYFQVRCLRRYRVSVASRLWWMVFWCRISTQPPWLGGRIHLHRVFTRHMPRSHGHAVSLIV